MMESLLLSSLLSKKNCRSSLMKKKVENLLKTLELR